MRLDPYLIPYTNINTDKGSKSEIQNSRTHIPEKTIILKDVCTPMFNAAIFIYNIQDMEAT